MLRSSALRARDQREAADVVAGVGVKTELLRIDLSLGLSRDADHRPRGTLRRSTAGCLGSCDAVSVAIMAVPGRDRRLAVVTALMGRARDVR